MSWNSNPIEGNLGAVLSALNHETYGIHPGSTLTREKLSLVIFCGKKPYAADARGECEAMAQRIFCTPENPCTAPDTETLPEWTFYKEKLENRAPSGYPNFYDVRLKYDLSYFHMLSGTEVLDYRLGFTGCTGDAKAAGMVLRYMGVNVRYVIGMDAPNYLAACGNCTGSACIGRARDTSYPVGRIINGHQVVALQMPNSKWRLLNTSYAGIVWGVDFYTKAIIEVDDPNDFKLQVVDYNFGQNHPSPGKAVVTGVYTLEQAEALLGDGYAHDTLMNLMVSDNPYDTTCRWNGNF